MENGSQAHSSSAAHMAQPLRNDAILCRLNITGMAKL
jgi:hypothetical protein